jgi:ABC-2 type transport system permease protein
MGTLYLVVLFKGLHYPLNAPFAWMWLDMTLLVLTAQAFGIFMIGTFPVLRDGLSFSGLFGVLSMSYSGLSFPIEGMPALLQGLSWVFPLRWYFLIYQGVALNGFNPVYYIQNYGIMLLFLCLPLLVAKRLRKAVIEMNYPKK